MTTAVQRVSQPAELEKEPTLSMYNSSDKIAL